MAPAPTPTDDQTKTPITDRDAFEIHRQLVVSVLTATFCLSLVLVDLESLVRFRRNRQHVISPLLGPRLDISGGLRNHRVILQDLVRIVLGAGGACLGHRSIDSVVVPVSVKQRSAEREKVSPVILMNRAGGGIRIHESILVV